MNHTITRHQGTVTITLPIRTVSEANQREHHMVKWRRAKAQRAMVGWAAKASCDELGGLLEKYRSLVVTLTRIAPGRGKRMDPDNYASSWKHIQDAVAYVLGVDDGDVDRVEWVYAPQERGDRYAVRIEVRQRGEVAA